MNFKELVDSVSNETEIPAAQVKKISSALLEKFSDMISKEESFRSPYIFFNTVNVPAKDAVGDKPSKPEHKLAKMLITVKKETE